EVARDPVGRVEVEQVVERRRAALQLGSVGQRAAAMRGLAVERGLLMRVLAVAQVVDLLEDEGEPFWKDLAAHLVEIGSDLGVVRRDSSEGFGRKLLTQLGRDPVELPKI